MNHYKTEEYKKIIAIKEMVSGNESVGSMWHETKSFPKDTPIYEIIEWAKGCDGKLIITIDESEIDTSKLAF